MSKKFIVISFLITIIIFVFVFIYLLIRIPEIDIQLSNEIFSDRLAVKSIYISKENPATIDLRINGKNIPNNKFEIINTNPNMIEFSEFMIKDVTVDYSDNTNASLIIKNKRTELQEMYEDLFGTRGERIRVLVGDLFLGRNVAFVFPANFIPKNEGNPNVNGELTLLEMMSAYDFVHVMDEVYLIQKELVGIVPIGEPFLYEFNYSVCGSAGQPIGLGYGCIEAPNNEPHWSLIAHETGHGFTAHIFFDNAESFGEFSAENSKRFSELNQLRYSESFATLNSLYSLYELSKNPLKYKIEGSSLISIKKAFNANRRMFDDKDCDQNEEPCSLYDYENRRSPFSEINPNVIDGIFIKIAEDNSINPYGWEVYKRFYKIFLSKNIEVSHEKQDTFFVAALSSATGNDLRNLFKKWNFPINDLYFEDIYRRLNSIF